MVPVAQWTLDHRLNGAVEGQGVCLIGRGRGSLLRPLLAGAFYCAHCGRPVLLAAPLVCGGGVLSTGAVPFMSAA